MLCSASSYALAAWFCCCYNFMSKNHEREALGAENTPMKSVLVYIGFTFFALIIFSALVVLLLRYCTLSRCGPDSEGASGSTTDESYMEQVIQEFLYGKSDEDDTVASVDADDKEIAVPNVGDSHEEVLDTTSPDFRQQRSHLQLVVQD